MRAGRDPRGGITHPHATSQRYGARRPWNRRSTDPYDRPPGPLAGPRPQRPAGVFVEGAQRITDLDLANGALRVLFEAPLGGWVTSASLSPDGQSIALAYVTIDPDDFINTLFLAASDGTSAGPAVEPVFLPYLDSPVFSRDSTWLYFSAVGRGGIAQANWFERLLAIMPAEAHSLPSEWWRVPVQGGPPERLTDLGQSGLFGAFSPDGRHFAFLSSTGLYVMDPDGSNVTPLINTWASGSLDWIP